MIVFCVLRSKLHTVRKVVVNEVEQDVKGKRLQGKIMIVWVAYKPYFPAVPTIFEHLTTLSRDTNKNKIMSVCAMSITCVVK